MSILLLGMTGAACRRAPEPAPAAVAARNLVLITVDTLRADRLGASGYAPARTPAMDALAARGTRFARAFAPTPITLPSHASIMTGRYPPGHGARHNGMRVDGQVPVLAESLARAGMATGAFVGAFPLDRRFGLSRGFETYDDRMPRVEGRLANERRGHDVVTGALAWLEQQRGRRFFLWVHLFEPHAPYGQPGDGGATAVRYDGEVAEADRQIGRVIEALGSERDATLVFVTADHGEAFGEHGEITHSLFVYDTTLHVPLIAAGPGVRAGNSDIAVSLVDLAPTAARLLGAGAFDSDGVDLGPALRGGTVAPRALYAESFAPLLDFGWSPLRSVREDGWKLIEAPRPELFHVATDPHESRNRAADERQKVAALAERVNRYSSASLKPSRPAGSGGPSEARDTASRLHSLGYVGSGSRDPAARPDPKDRRDLAAGLARVVSGEVRGPASRRSCAGSSPWIPTTRRLTSGWDSCCRSRGAARPRPRTSRRRSRDSCRAPIPTSGWPPATLRHGASRPRPPCSGMPTAPSRPTRSCWPTWASSCRMGAGLPRGSIPLGRALDIDPDFHQARFNLAVALARLGKRADAAREAEELLRRLPPGAPQRREVERLVAAVR